MWNQIVYKSPRVKAATFVIQDCNSDSGATFFVHVLYHLRAAFNYIVRFETGANREKEKKRLGHKDQKTQKNVFVTKTWTRKQEVCCLPRRVRQIVLYKAHEPLLNVNTDVNLWRILVLRARFQAYKMY